jgi:hypothetical protein
MQPVVFSSVWHHCTALTSPRAEEPLLSHPPVLALVVLVLGAAAAAGDAPDRHADDHPAHPLLQLEAAQIARRPLGLLSRRS